jgi:hypothetical protein
MKERIPFEVAIADRKLLGKRFQDELSKPQQVILKAFYGLPLSDEELRYWSILQRRATYDHLGYPVSVQDYPYTPKEYHTLACILGRRAGKALDVETLIPTPQGFKPMRDVEVGDVVFSKDGSPVAVTFVSPVFFNNPCYRVETFDGVSVVRDADHQWVVEDKNSRKHKPGTLRVVTTQQMLDEGIQTTSGESRFAIPLTGAVQYQEASLPMDPYVLGVWLGDGTASRAEITTTDAEVLEAIRTAGYEQSYTAKTEITFGFVNGFRRDLKAAEVLGNKHIPDAYLRRSVEQRLALLQGLMDSDGYCTKRGSVEFANTNFLLRTQTRELAESLGFKTTLREKDAKLYGRFISKCYTVAFCATMPVFRLERKLNRQVTTFMGRKRYVKSITPVESRPVKCIAVEGETYLATSSYLVTHNTDAITATVLAYERLLGGHLAHVREDQDTQIFLIAQDIDTAASHLNFVAQAINSSKLLSKEIETHNAQSLVLKNGLKLVPAPPTIKSSRGLAIPVINMDEAGFWYTDPKAVNPDYEVERAVQYAMSQFPHAKQILTSTPYIKRGLVWDYFRAGTDGVLLTCSSCAKAHVPCGHMADERERFQDTLVVHASTAAMENPRIDRKRLIRLQSKDPEAFIRESLAQFVDSISGFFKPDLVEQRVDTGVKEREKLPRPGHSDDPTPFYVAAMDPAFRHDAFTFTVMHADPRYGIVQDALIRKLPVGNNPINPVDALNDIKFYLNLYGITTVYSDQYQLESLQQLAVERGFNIVGVDFTANSKAKIYGSLRALINQKRVRLLDHPEITSELIALEKRRTQTGHIQISAPPGGYDDVAAVIALCTHQALWLLPRKPPEAPAEPSLLEQGLDHIRRKQQESLGEFD